MPFFGGAAKHWYRCKGREFTGTFDDCFNDYIPIMEILLPFVCLFLLYAFSRFAFSLFAPSPELRTLRWRLATGSKLGDLYPIPHIVPAIGVLWTLWRASTYSIVPALLPYFFFWVVFAAWFAFGLALAWPRKAFDGDNAD
jgi:hypothetical protein